jgi:hypothetical protein
MRTARASLAGKLGIILIVFFCEGASAPAFAQSANPAPKPQVDAERLARDVFHNEIQAQLHDSSLWCYRDLKEEHGDEKLFGVCQSKNGEIERLLEVNGQELNPKQRQVEEQRIERMLNSPDQMRQEQKKEQEDARQERELMKMFPDAFLFRYEGMQGSLIKLGFSPNPNFHPSGRPAQVFHHLEGSLLVDDEQKRLAEINGQLTSEVRFGWGLFGHLDKGGTFLVKQEDLGSGHWELTMMDVEMNGKALFFKTIAVREKKICSDFRQIPDSTSLQQAYEYLRQDPEFRRYGK